MEKTRCCTSCGDEAAKRGGKENIRLRRGTPECSHASLVADMGSKKYVEKECVFKRIEAGYQDKNQPPSDSGCWGLQAEKLERAPSTGAPA